MHFLAGSRYEHIQPPPTPRLAARPEPPLEPASPVRAVGGADNDMVALVALDVFQILDEQAFKRPRTATAAGISQPRCKLLVVLRQLVKLFHDQVTLRHIEAGNADRRRFGSFQKI